MIIFFSFASVVGGLIFGAWYWKSRIKVMAVTAIAFLGYAYYEGVVASKFGGEPIRVDLLFIFPLLATLGIVSIAAGIMRAVEIKKGAVSGALPQAEKSWRRFNIFFWLILVFFASLYILMNGAFGTYLILDIAAAVVLGVFGYTITRKKAFILLALLGLLPEMAHFALSPLFATATFDTYRFITRTIEPALFVAGQLAGYLIIWRAKRRA